MPLPRILISLSLLSIAFTGCRKGAEDMGPLAGTLRLEVQVRHHALAVPGLTVFLEDGVTEFPGYDTLAYHWKKQADSTGKAIFSGLFPGNYYLYSKGYDPVWGDTVIGYMSITLNSANIVDNTLSTELYVSE